MEGAVELQLAHALERCRGFALAQQVQELVADALAGDGVESARLDRLPGQLLGALVEPAAETRLVAQCAQEPRRVVDEAAVVQHADRTGVEVGAAVVRVEQGLVGQGHGHRVDREVPTREVLLDARGLDVWERAGLGIALAPGRGEMDVRIVEAHRGRPEAIVLDHFSPQSSSNCGRGLPRVALDGKIQIDGIRAAEVVSHRPSHDVRGRQALERRQQVAKHHARTGMPAERIASLASRTVYEP